LKDVANQFELALSSAAYYERSYYSAPSGFAMVTRLERFKPDGSPDGELRWSGPDKKEEFSIAGYLKRLLIAEPGHYRLIVFVVTTASYSATGTAIGSKKATQLLAEGHVALPQSFARAEFTSAHSCTALIYEFRKEAAQQNAELVHPSMLPGRTHLDKAKLWRALVPDPSRQ
jgi:hypothetical protein